MCLGMQNDQAGSRQQSVKKGGNVVQVQSQKGTALLGRCVCSASGWRCHQDLAFKDIKSKINSTKFKKKKKWPRKEQRAAGVK